MDYRMSVGRDYRSYTAYEYIIYKGEDIIARVGFFKSSTQARRAGLKAWAAMSVEV